MTPIRAIISTGMLAVWSMLVLGWSLASGPLEADGNVLRAVTFGPLLLLGPGTAFTLLLMITDRLLAVVVSVGASCTVLVIASQILLYSGRWSPGTVVNAVACVTMVVACADLVRRGIAPRVRARRTSDA